jgi:hypothetical protein
VTSVPRQPTGRRIMIVLLVTIPVGFVVPPLLSRELAPKMDDEVGVALMLLLAFGYLPLALWRRAGVRVRCVLSRLVRSQMALSLVGAGVLFVCLAVVAMTGEKWGLATSLLLAAASVGAFALERADYDATGRI